MPLSSFANNDLETYQFSFNETDYLRDLNTEEEDRWSLCGTAGLGAGNSVTPDDQDSYIWGSYEDWQNAIDVGSLASGSGSSAPTPSGSGSSSPPSDYYGSFPDPSSETSSTDADLGLVDFYRHPSPAFHVPHYPLTEDYFAFGCSSAPTASSSTSPDSDNSPNPSSSASASSTASDLGLADFYRHSAPASHMFSHPSTRQYSSEGLPNTSLYKECLGYGSSILAAPTPSSSTSSTEIDGSSSNPLKRPLDSEQERLAPEPKRRRRQPLKNWQCMWPRKNGGQCNATFGRPQELARHQNKSDHSGEMVFFCKTMGCPCNCKKQVFDRKDSARRHTRNMLRKYGKPIPDSTS